MNHIFLRIGFCDGIYLKVYNHSSQLYINSKIAQAINSSNTPVRAIFDEEKVTTLTLPFRISENAETFSSDAIKRIGEAGIAGAKAGEKLREEYERR